MLRADALPVVFDEADSNERADQQRMQAVLAVVVVNGTSSQFTGKCKFRPLID